MMTMMPLSSAARGSSVAAAPLAVSCSGRAASSTTMATTFARSASPLRHRQMASPRCRAANLPGGLPDPEALKAAMADPAVQKQVQEMSAAMENENVKRRFEELRVRRYFLLIFLAEKETSPYSRLLLLFRSCWLPPPPRSRTETVLREQQPSCAEKKHRETRNLINAPPSPPSKKNNYRTTRTSSPCSRRSKREGCPR